MAHPAQAVHGIHHVTAIAADPQENLDFYSGVLGLRLVKKTVNYDDPGTYHLYYGDAEGSPGSILTFFIWSSTKRGTGAGEASTVPRGRPGVGQPTAISFSAPAGSLVFWRDRLASSGIETKHLKRRFDEEVLAVRDPDGIELELVGLEDGGDAGAARAVWAADGIPAEHALRGLHSVLLSEEGYERTAALMIDLLGFRFVAERQNIYRYEAGEGGPGTFVDVACLPTGYPGTMGVGAIHHVAWRAAADAGQLALRERLVRGGVNVTPVIDRTYFHSIYFREPGNVLFEVATDPPGFSVDEPPDRLGGGLMLPAWLERYRERIERVLPAVRAPRRRRAAA